MIDDLEAEFLQEEQELREGSTTKKFPLTSFQHPALKPGATIISMSVSKKYIYLLTNNAEILLIQSYSLIPYSKTIKIPSSQYNSNFIENLSKIWSDRSGNHNIIRYKGGIFYFNINFSIIKELKSFKNIEICAVGFDDRNEDTKNTRKFLAADNLNNLYECNISVLEKGEEINEKVEKIAQINFTDWENDEEDDYVVYRQSSYNNDRIYGIKLFKATKAFLQPSEDAYYIIIVTKNKFYQFRGPVINNFRQIFGRYDSENVLYSDSCKFFPECYTIKFNENDLNILYRKDKRKTGGNNLEEVEIFNQFGWKTESGYCFGRFEYNNSLDNSGLPYDQKNFTVMPFSKINNIGQRIERIEPVDIAQTNGHIFLLYEDCLTIISKLTSYIVHTQYFNNKYHKIIYNEFSKDNEIMLLASENGLSQISLKDENNDIWKEYLEIGDFDKAQLYCPSEKLKKRIFRIEGDEYFDKKDRFNAVNKFIYSDESFENICLKYLINNDFEGLSMYLELYMGVNLNKDIWKEWKKKEEQKNNIEVNEEEEEKKDYDYIQLLLICNWIIEITLTQSLGKDSNLSSFRQTIHDNKNYLLPKLIYEMLLNYGREEEYVEFGSKMGDYEKVILYYVNHGEIDKALEKIEWFVAFSDDEETISKISKIFCTYSHIFFKSNSKKAISILQQNLKDISVELIVHAIASNTDKNKNFEKLTKEEIANNQAILEYLKFLIDKPKYEHESNLHNLYIYYLSRNKAHQQTLIEYLKNLLKNDENENNKYLNKKKEVLFQLSYAKRLLQDNNQAYAFILALMGKYEEGVKCALMGESENCQRIAKYIASNAPGEKLKKKLWINIFSYNNQNEFKKGLDIMKESKILKIEDILPHITEKIKIEDFKTQISDCIIEYEKNIQNLKDDINGYKEASENIKNDINKIKKKSMEIKKNAGKCDICQKIIQDKNIFIFPCGHLFDMFCIKERLLDYEVTGIDYLHDKNVQIDELFLKLEYTKERVFQGKNSENENEDEPGEEDNNNIIRKENSQKIGNAKKKLVFLKRVKNYKQINLLKTKLFGLLSEQCPLCGDFLVDSVQFTLDQKDVFKPDKNGLRLKIPREPDFMF